MATSGSKSVTVTSWDTLKFSWWENSQSVISNTTNVGWKLELIAGSSGRISSTADKDWSVTVNGKSYSGTNTVGISANSTKTLASGTTTIEHDAYGEKEFSYSFSQEFAITFSGTYIGTKSGSGKGTLEPIARASVIGDIDDFTISNGLTVPITKYLSSATHHYSIWVSDTRIRYEKGVTDDFKITFTQSELNKIYTLLSNATTGVFTVYLDTYIGDDLIGSSPSATAKGTIPSSIKPSCEIVISDTAGHFETYGAYIEGQSELSIEIKPTLAYGSSIASYSTTVDGVNYTSAKFTTGALNSSGTQEIKATVKDKRSRSGTATESITVLDYSSPQITLLKVKRCKSLEDGTEDIYGEFCQVTFSAVVSALNDRNSVNYVLEYKKASESWESRVSIPLTEYADNYNVTEGYHRFVADSGSSFNIRIVATDNFTDDTKTTPLSTGEVMEHWRADGKGMGFGKIGEVENGADFGWKIKANKGFINIPLEEDTDLNDVTTPNTYISFDKVASTYVNCPVPSGTFSLEVVSGGNEGQLQQTLTYTSKKGFKVFHRQYYAGDWAKDSDGNYIWNCTYSAQGNLLWSGAWYMHETQIATLSQKISEQPNGIVLVFSRYANGEALSSAINSFFVPKYAVSSFNRAGHSFLLTEDVTNIATKYLYIYDEQIKGYSQNDEVVTANGITYTNDAFVLRYVIGV